jgi:hypothetical protein
VKGPGTVSDSALCRQSIGPTTLGTGTRCPVPGAIHGLTRIVEIDAL